MFIGHYAVGFAAKRAAPRANLAVLLAAPLLLDLLWPVFVLAHWERFRVDPGNTAFTPLAFDSYPYSHSLLTTIIWGVLFAGVYFAVTRYRAGALVVAAGALSHWVLDAVTHRPDLPLYPGGPLVGAGLWRSVPGTIAVEIALFGAGIWLYIKATPGRKRGGLAGFIAVLLAIYAANIASPPPPNEIAVVIGALALSPFLLWAWAIDRTR